MVTDDAPTPIAPPVDLAAMRGLFDLTGRTALVAGATGGLGETIAYALSGAGAQVAVTGRDPARTEALAAAIEAATGRPAAGFGMEATETGSIRRAVAAAHRRFGRLDILVNSMGIQIEEPLLDVREESFDKVYSVNLKAAMFLAQAVSRHQVTDGGDGRRHIHLLSVRSQLAIRGKGYSAYCATKGALAMLVKQHAMELAPHGITVNGVAPTFVNTELIRHVYDRPDFRDAILARIPLGRIADPIDVAGAVLFLASAASNFVTGQVVFVDGGITASQ
ncbi:SDR family NAD(P)-dependent oxidoreductase [Prosthecodimorpha staleyi]|uniref:SDR family oxidoreductase n=1 Tax=Prosthecodimorpha staleyi TaxID=2840188 RepID=A0A947D7F7_9HYPH|nr:SDR family oxidoreductase [Prosthecodimorpha staleyi]MBT9290936.1 SDR family oxidoreductase [Prosthecodimorpha staleyi]